MSGTLGGHTFFTGYQQKFDLRLTVALAYCRPSSGLSGGSHITWFISAFCPHPLHFPHPVRGTIVSFCYYFDRTRCSRRTTLRERTRAPKLLQWNIHLESGLGLGWGEKKRRNHGMDTFPTLFRMRLSRARSFRLEFYWCPSTVF